MKGWIIFAAVLFVGILLLIAGLAYEIAVDGVKTADLPARVLASCGLAVSFAAIYGAALWRFLRWRKLRDNPPPD